MTFTIQFSKNAKFHSKTINTLDPKDAEKFKFLMQLRAKEMKTDNITYKIKNV